MTPAQEERIEAAISAAYEIAKRTDVQFALMVGQGAVGIAIRALGCDDRDPDALDAMGALMRLRARLAERARETR